MSIKMLLLFGSSINPLPPHVYYLVDIDGNQYVDIDGNLYIEVQ